MMNNENTNEYVRKFKIPNKRGAPFGNQNARTHGFYAKSLSKKEQEALEEAAEVKGVDNEIALLRVKIASIIDSDTENVRALNAAISTLARLLKINDTLRKNNPEGLAEISSRVFRQEVAPLGLWPVFNEDGDIVLVETDRPLPHTGGRVLAEGTPEEKQAAREYTDSLNSQAQEDEIK
jgi:hypothetical protein